MYGYITYLELEEGLKRPIFSNLKWQGTPNLIIWVETVDFEAISIKSNQTKLKHSIKPEISRYFLITF